MPPNSAAKATNQAGDAGLAETRAEVTADVDDGQVSGGFADQDGAMDGHHAMPFALHSSLFDPSDSGVFVPW